MTFCERLAKIRKDEGKTKAEMARALGMSSPGYSRLENETGGKSFQKLPLIAKALGCRIDDLFPEMDDAEGKTVRADGSDEMPEGWEA